MAKKISEDTEVKLDIKTIGLLVGGVISLASMWFTLQADIAEAKELPKPEISRTEYDLKDELIRSTILDTQDDVEDIKEKIRPAADYFIPYQTKLFKEKGYDCFFSIQTSKKRNAVKRLTKIIDDDLGYRLLPGLYQTSSNSTLGWQNVSATTDKIDLPYKSIH